MYIILALLCTINLFGDVITTYQELASAMRNGNSFVIVVDFQKCSDKPGMPIGNFCPSSMMQVAASDAKAEKIVTSHLHFSDHAGPTYEYVKYVFNFDNSVDIQTTFYDPLSFKPKGSHSIHCLIGKGVEIHTTANKKER